MSLPSFPSLFPNPKDFGDIIAVSQELTKELLIDAYSHGIFPWPMGEEEEIPWFCPEKRAILFFDDLHISRSLLRSIKRGAFSLTLNQSFPQVIHACASSPRKDQDGTWITSRMIEAYTELHQSGFALSAEAWDPLTQELVGGVYGVFISGLFSAESMFHKKSDASKLALIYLIQFLKSKGLRWMDIQVMSPHLQQLGAREIPRAQFLKLLEDSKLSSSETSD